MLEILGHPDVIRWLGGDPVPMADLAAAAAKIVRWRRWAEIDPRHGVWAVEERATGVAAGSVLLQPIEGGEGAVEIGWHLHPDCWGRGLGREVARGLVVHGFAIGYEVLHAFTDVENVASARLCADIGMVDLGVARNLWDADGLRHFTAARPQAGAGDA